MHETGANMVYGSAHVDYNKYKSPGFEITEDMLKGYTKPQLVRALLNHNRRITALEARFHSADASTDDAQWSWYRALKESRME